MKVNVSITVHRNDGTILTREVRAEKQVSRYYRDGWTKNETKAQLRARVESMVTAALNSTLGR